MSKAVKTTRVKGAPQPYRAYLDKDEQHEAQERSFITVQVVHGAIGKQGDEKLNRPAWTHPWSKLAAGFSIGMYENADVALRVLRAIAEHNPVLEHDASWVNAEEALLPLAQISHLILFRESGSQSAKAGG
jgi:hypothetical protein